MISTERAVAALIDWVNAFPVEPKINTLEDLGDGNVLAKVLVDIDPYYFRATALGHEVSREGHWVLRFHKLKRIQKDLSRYYTETLGHRLPSVPPNLTAIAKDGDRDEMLKLCKIVVVAAVQSDRREEYVKKIRELSSSSQTELMAMISQMMELDDNEDIDPPLEKSVMADTDENEFRMEEEMARVGAQNEALEAEKRSLKREVERLQDSLDESQRSLEILREQIGGDGIADNYAARADALTRLQLDQLQSDVQKLEDIITEKDSLIQSQESKINSLTRKVDDLLPKAEAATKWKDDLDEASHMIEKLRKGQNVADKYRKKLEGMGELERQVKTLEAQNVQLLQNLRQGEETSRQVPGLRKLVETYKKQIEKTENDNAELIRSKQRMEIEFSVMKEKVAGADVQKSKDTEQIQLLEEKVRELEDGIVSKAVEEVNGDLEAELNFTTKTKADLKLQISRLEKEIERLKEGGGTTADNVILKNLLEDTVKAKEKIEHDYLQTHTEKLLLESQLAALKAGSEVGEGSDVMISLRQQLVEQDHDLTTMNKRLSGLEVELSIAKKELMTAKSDLSLVGKDKLEVLAELKKLTSAELISLQEEHEALQKKAKEIEADNNQKKSLINTILLEKDELNKKEFEHKDILLEKEKAIAELKATVAAFEGSSEGRDAALEKRVVQLQNKVEDQREKMTKSREHIKKQNGIIKDLKEKLENTSADTDKLREEHVAESKRKKKEELALVQKEVRLMATAWYDLAGRLQMNTVALSRRTEPASWLNKQRQAVHSPIRK